MNRHLNVAPQFLNLEPRGADWIATLRHDFNEVEHVVIRLAIPASNLPMGAIAALLVDQAADLLHSMRSAGARGA